MEIVIALLIAVPVILIPVVFVWYLNISGVWSVVKTYEAKKVKQVKQVKTEA